MHTRELQIGQQTLRFETGKLAKQAGGSVIVRYGDSVVLVTACRAAGYPGRLLHDLRRSAVRNLELDGVPRSAAMAMVGHKTESIYRRYAIVDSGVLRDAATKIDRAARGQSAGTGTEKPATATPAAPANARVS